MLSSGKQKQLLSLSMAVLSWFILFVLNKFFADKYGLSTQLLHAYRVEFTDAVDCLDYLIDKTFQANLPKDFKIILKDLGGMIKS